MLAVLLAAATPMPATLEERYGSERPALRTAKLETWPRLYRENDADGLDAFLADDFVALSADGSIETKAQAVDWVRKNKWSNAIRNFRYDISAIEFIEPGGVANVYGVGSYDGPNCRMRYTSANIFVYQGRWRPRFSHTSKAVCEEAR